MKTFYKAWRVTAVMKWSERYVLARYGDGSTWQNRRRFGVLTSFPDSEERV